MLGAKTMYQKLKILFCNIRKQIVSIALVLATIGAFLGNINHFPAFFDNLTLNKTVGSEIHGIWLSKYSYPVTGGIVDIHGTTEYFKNNHYNFVGEIGLRILSKGNSVYVLYNVDGTGVWQLDPKSLTIRLENIHSWPKFVLLNGKSADIHLLESILTKDFPKIEEALPVGINEEFGIVELTDDKFVINTDSPNGETFDIAMLKKTIRFQR